MTPAKEDKRDGSSSLLGTIKAVGWSFFGIRKNSGYQDDLSRLNPLHVIVAAFAGVAIFVGGLILLVRYVVSP